MENQPPANVHLPRADEDENIALEDYAPDRDAYELDVNVYSEGECCSTSN